MSEQRAPAWTPDPALPGYVTDGGLETDLIFHHGVELPHFAAFPLLVDPKGRELLTDYYAGYAEIAAAAGAGLFLETPTWRANFDWGARLGVGADGLAGVNTDAVRLLAELGARSTPATSPRSWWPERSGRAVTATSWARRWTRGRRATTTSRRPGRSPTPAPTWSAR